MALNHLKHVLVCTSFIAAGLPGYAADKVKVGMLTTLSGPNAVIGVDIRDGFNLALKHSGG